MSFWKDVGGGLLTGGLSLVGNVVGGILESNAQKKTNEANKAMAENQMAFQERMSNTAYQRAMKDMTKAGLNPMLAFSQGGASSPVGAMPVMGNTGAGLASGIKQGISSAVETKRVSNLKKLQQQQVEVGKKDIELKDELKETEVTRQKVNQSAAIKNQAASLREITQKKLLDAQLVSAGAKARYEKRRDEINAEWAGLEKFLDLTGKGADSIEKLLRGVSPINLLRKRDKKPNRYKGKKKNTLKINDRLDKDGYVRDDIPF